MAIRLCPAYCSWCLLAQSEQCSAMAKPSVSWFVSGGAICLVVGLLALPDILPADSVRSCFGIRIRDRRRLVGFFAKRPLASGANVLCRSPLEQRISSSEQGRNYY